VNGPKVRDDLNSGTVELECVYLEDSGVAFSARDEEVFDASNHAKQAHCTSCPSVLNAHLRLCTPPTFHKTRSCVHESSSIASEPSNVRESRRVGMWSDGGFCNSCDCSRFSWSSEGSGKIRSGNAASMIVQPVRRHEVVTVTLTEPTNRFVDMMEEALNAAIDKASVLA
jgi:hypothetical protein